jgi:single-strand DNA-binding protein
MARDLNKVLLIGNLTHDPELRETDSGHPVCGFRVATKRVWKSGTGEQKEDTQYHRIVAWDQLGTLCGRYLKKGRRVYLEGRLTTREYEKDGEKRMVSEVVLDDMILLDAKPIDPAGSSEAALAGSSELNRPIVDDAEALAGEIPF